MKPITRVLLAIAACIPAPLMAQSDDAGEVEALPLYDVEVVIFKNIKAPSSREFVLPVSSPGRDEKIFDISSPASVAAAGELNYRLLPASGYRLIEQVTRLVQSPRYELLAHVAWRQPGVEKEQALPIWIKGGRIFGEEYISIDSRIEVFENKAAMNAKAADSGTVMEFDEQSLEALELQMLEQRSSSRHGGLFELEGKITIALSRYLHSYVDLVLRPTSTVGRPGVEQPGSGRVSRGQRRGFAHSQQSQPARTSAHAQQKPALSG